jgi:hypothetical protein
MANVKTIYRSEAFQTSFDESTGMVRYLTFHRHPDGRGSLAITWKHYADNGKRTTNEKTESLGRGYDLTDTGWTPRVGLMGAITQMGAWEAERQADGDVRVDLSRFGVLLGPEFLGASHYKNPALMDEFGRHSICLGTPVTIKRPLRLKTFSA